MHKRKYKLISFILAITLFLTGIYLDTAADDAFFLCGSVGETAFCPKSFHTNINNLMLFERELLNECSGIEQQSIALHPFLLLLHLNRFSVLQGRSFRHSETMQSFCQTLDGLVTDYMHQSDGKKRN